MNDWKSALRVSGILMVAVLTVTVAGADDAPTVAEQIAGMQAMCADTIEARAQRQADETLYIRLGGADKINDFTTEVVRLHNQNPTIMPMLLHVNSEELATQVANFIIAGTGGPDIYTGRSLPASHDDLNLTDADFLSAGGDIVTAMQTMGYGENEITDFVCILVSLKDQVVSQ